MSLCSPSFRHSPLWLGRSVWWFRGAELQRSLKISVRWKTEWFNRMSKTLELFGWPCMWGIQEEFCTAFPIWKTWYTTCSLASKFSYGCYVTNLQFSKPQRPECVLFCYISMCLILFFLLFLMLEQPIQAFSRMFCCSSAVEIAVYPFVIWAWDRCMLFVLPQSLFIPCGDFPFQMAWGAGHSSFNICLLGSNILTGSYKVESKDKWLKAYFRE